MKFLRIREWEQYQHYKDRNPPWIKLHRSLLRSYTWEVLDDTSRLLAVVCMILASETGNKIPLDRDFIQRSSHLRRRPDIRPLIDVGFAEVIEDNGSVADASKVEQMLQNVRPETETETEKRKNKSLLPPDFGISDSVRTWALRKGYNHLEERLEHFVGYAKANGKTYSDWDQAFQNAIRGDWAKLNNGNTNHRPRGNPQCADCHGAGIRASKLTPGRTVVCECVPGEVSGTV